MMKLPDLTKPRRALLSVYNKEGIVPFAQELVDLGFEIYSSGGTARALMEGDVETIDVAELVGGAAILGHRVVTLSREVHAGLLAQYVDADIAEMEALGLPYLDLVVNDVYPLKQEIARVGSTIASVIEQTDIGGPCMLRSAAKGGRIVICTMGDRVRVLEWLKAGEPNPEDFIEELRATAEAYVSDYCLASARYHGNGVYNGMVGKRALTCRYGENGYQTPAALYGTGTDDPLALDKFTVIQGADPSFNNLCDIDRLLQTMTHIMAGIETNLLDTQPKIVIACKHGNPCGMGMSPHKGRISAIQRAVDGDTRAIFGGLVMLNFTVDIEAAEALLAYLMPEGQRRLLDGIIAPAFTLEAVEYLKRKGDKCRLLTNLALADLGVDSLDTATRFRYVRGGFLTQPNYTFVPKVSASTSQRTRDLVLAWAIGCTSNSNTITLVKDGMLIGNGVGQQDRVGCAELAIKRAKDAGHEIEGAVAYSDSFFPFNDGIEALHDAGVEAIFATSGSMNDPMAEAFCHDVGIELVMVPDSEGRGFFGH